MVDGLAIRPAVDADKLPVAELWTHAFPGERTVADRVRQLEDGKPYGGLDVTFVAELHKRVVGAFRAYKMAEAVNGTLMPMMGLASVGVSPDVRRRGVGKNLCRHALMIARERGDYISVLFPFRPDFYNSLGWGFVGEMHSYRFRPEALPADDRSLNVRLATSSDHEAIASCYDRVARASNGLILRSSYVWKQHIGGDATHAVVYEHDGVRGYAILVYGRGVTREQRPLWVREVVTEDQHAYCGLFGWLSEQRDLWRDIRYDARPEDLFAFRLRDPRPPTERHARNLWDPIARIIRGPMLRIVNLREAVQRRQYQIEHELSLRLSLFDAEIDDNRGDWRVVFRNERAEIEPWRNGRVAVELTTNIAAFSQMFAGEISASEAVRLGQTQASGNVAALDRVLDTHERFWLLDEF